MPTIDVLRAVHHPTRRRILDHLLVHGDSQVGVLARELDQQVGSISHHLRMLERAGMVERAPERSTDGRTSWWRATPGGLSWDVEDFADRPAELVQARAAERLNFEHQLHRFREWQARRKDYGPGWRRAAFSADGVGQATPAELSELSRLIAQTVTDWRQAIDTDDGKARQPVYWFARGFPMKP